MLIEGTGLQADSFRGKGPVLLSHYHRDHMDGLAAVKPGRAIYCSPVTARLLHHLDGVPAEQIQVVTPGKPFQPAPGVTVSALDSNHCPGALMFHIRAAGRRILYTGDFRLNDALRERCAPLAPVDVLYLDTTYDAPHYRFPPQREAIEEVLALIRASEAETVYLAVYTVGKDRLLEAVHRAFGEPVLVSRAKHAACTLMGLGHMVTRDRHATRYRAYARGYFERYFKMHRAYRRGEALVIIPTGWAVDTASRDPAYRYVAYSEHCDYAELCEFRRLVRPARIVPLV